MQKSKAVYAVWVAYQNTNTGTIHTDMWGSAPWVEKELGGKVGIVDIIWKAKAMQHLTAPQTVDGLGQFEPVMAALKKYNLEHLQSKFRENKIDAVAFRGITDNMLSSIGIVNLGDRIKLLEAATEIREDMAIAAAAQIRAMPPHLPMVMPPGGPGPSGGGGGGGFGGGGLGGLGVSVNPGTSS